MSRWRRDWPGCGPYDGRDIQDIQAPDARRELQEITTRLKDVDNRTLRDPQAATSAIVAPAAASSAVGSAENTASCAPAAAQTMSYPVSVSSA